MTGEPTPTVSAPDAAGASTPAAAVAPAAPRPMASLRVNFTWTFAGHVVSAACQMGMMVVIARLGAPEALGRYALGSAVTAPVFLLVGLNLIASQVTDASRSFTFGDYLRVRFIGMALGVLVVAGLAWLGSYDHETRLVLLAFALSKAIDGVLDTHYGLYQQNEGMRPMAASLIARAVLGLVLVGVVLLAGGGIVLAVLALAATSLIVLFAHDVPLAARLVRSVPHEQRRGFDRGVALQLVWTSLPLGVVMMLVSLRTNIPRYFIEHFRGAGELGVFAALSSVVAVGNLVITALGQSATPRMARHFVQGEVRAFRRLLAQMLLIAAVVGIGGLAVSAVAGRMLLQLAFGGVYAARTDTLLWLMGAGLVAYCASFFGCALTATRGFSVQLPMFAFTCAACAATSWLLVPRSGLVGAAVAWGVALLLEIGAAGAVLSYRLRRRARAG